MIKGSSPKGKKVVTGKQGPSANEEQ